MAAGQLWPPPACTMRATKTGITSRRPSVSAFGRCASGAGTARVDIPDKSTTTKSRLRERVKARCPVGGTHEVRRLGGSPGEAPGPVVRGVAMPDLRGLDLCAFAPLVVARDRDDVRSCRECRAPEVVVGRSVRTRAVRRELAGPASVEPGADAR